ncbi:coiled-coil domain-containing protein 138-like isoform X1 [Leucoraja erinacea]|uniref:coiled-coil domain-containing protein 138-like isoform X1 n=2 Tax=Leucoraja erinaceus TaxID=7782 RepID=UPI0024566576|nr:coiled-coil domain-containing protein 138-like isoform X1 [Leucoraja erinacea]
MASSGAAAAAADCDIERWKQRYLGGGDAGDSRWVSSGSAAVQLFKTRLSNFEDGDTTLKISNNNSKNNSAIEDAMETLPEQRYTRNLMKSSTFGLTYTERRHYNRLLHNLYKTIKLNSACVDDANEYPQYSTEELEEYLNEEELAACKKQDSGTQFYTETDVTLPSGLASTNFTSATSHIDDSITELKNGSLSESWENPCLLPVEIMQIHNELTSIWQHLQKESVALQEYRCQLQSHEQHLANREALLIKHQDALTKLRGVEEEVHAKFEIMKEQHAAEVSQLTNAIKEKIKENKRLKSSFDSLKELNDSLKKQVNNITQQNMKLEVQNKKIQSRLENLQRKHELHVVQKLHENASAGAKAIRLEKQEKIQPARRINRPILNDNLCELLGVLLDWTSDGYLCYLTAEDDNDVQKSLSPKCLPRKSVQEMCVKILPLIKAQIYLMPPGDIKLQLALAKFIYWALRHVDRRGTQQTVITSTMRRLGEELFQGTTNRTAQDSPSELIDEAKSKASAFFKSSNLNVRFLSTLSILKTITQVDYLAQAFNILLVDLNTDEGKALFLEYQALQVILDYLKPSSKNLLSSAVDIILQMTMESSYLQNFLEACSTESLFHSCSMILKGQKLDIQILEKLSVILQKLSKIKNNKKLFELFSIHIFVQEWHRTMDPEQTFLTQNLQSILFNLGITKGTAQPAV